MLKITGINDTLLYIHIKNVFTVFAQINAALVSRRYFFQKQ